MTATDMLVFQRSFINKAFEETPLYPNTHAALLFTPASKWKLSRPTPHGSSKLKARSQAFSMRSEVQRWFESLPYEKKISASTILDEEFIRHFLQLSISPSRKKLVHLPSGRVLMDMANNETERQFDHSMVSSFRLAIMGQPQLYIISRQILGCKLFAWLDKISGGRAFNLQTKQLRSSAAYRSKCKDELEENILWFSKRSFHRLEAWFGNQLEMTLLDSYFNFTHTYSRIVDFQKYLATIDSEPEILQNISLTLEQIAENSVMKVFEAVKQKIITYETSMREIFEVELLNEIQRKEKKKKRRKPAKKIALSSDETSSTKPTFHNSIENQQITDQCPTEDLSQILNKINFQEQNNSSSDQKEESAEISQISHRNSKQCSRRSFSPKSSQKENDENVSITFPNAEVVEIDGQTVEDDFKKVQPVQCEKKKKKRRRNHKESSVVISSFKEKVFMIILNKQLTDYIDRLCIETNNLYESKIIAFQRVRVFVQNIFPAGQAILFGSNAVGLSLPSSDIDIMLFSLNCGSREEANNCLSQIASLINTMGWVTSCSTYLAAKVPLIKLQIDTSINYFAGKGTNGYIASTEPLGYYLEVKDRKKCSVIKVDITISLDERNLCSPSTELMRERVAENAQMQRILLILKHILAIKGFNQNFTGGIGSYCLFVMVAAYFVQFKPSKAENQADTFLSILKFYGQDFDNNTRIVSIHRGLVETDASAFPKYAEYEKKIDNPQPLISSNLLKIVDPLTGSIMSNSRNQFLQIKAQFSRIRSEIMDFSADVQEEINKFFGSPVTELPKLTANPRQFDRWVSKYELRSGFSVEQIIQYE